VEIYYIKCVRALDAELKGGNAFIKVAGKGFILKYNFKTKLNFCKAPHAYNLYAGIIP
jgi:hypothetical protein